MTWITRIAIAGALTLFVMPAWADEFDPISCPEAVKLLATPPMRGYVCPTIEGAWADATESLAMSDVKNSMIMQHWCESIGGKVDSPGLSLDFSTLFSCVRNKPFSKTEIKQTTTSDSYSLEFSKKLCMLDGHVQHTDKWRPGWEKPCKRIEEIESEKNLAGIKAFIARNDAPTVVSQTTVPSAFTVSIPSHWSSSKTDTCWNGDVQIELRGSNGVTLSCPADRKP